MADLTGQQLKDSYQNLVTIDATIESNPTSGQLENGLGNPITALGIGTDAPASNLEISGNATRLMINTANSAQSVGLLFALTQSSVASIFSDVSEQNLIFNTSGSSEAMRIDSGGDISFRDGATNEAFYWDASAGSLGIGTTSPSSFLPNGNELVLGNGSGSHGMTIFSDSAGTGNLFFADGTTGDEAYRGFLRYNHADDAMVIFTAGANERMRIDSSGNVGIGNTSPSSYGKTTIALGAVGGNVLALQKDSGAGIAFYGASFNNTGLLESQSASGDMVFYTGTSGVSEKMRIDSSGNVGIGTNSPSSFFVGANNLVVGENSSDNGITIFTGASNTGYLLFSNGTSGNEQYKGQVRYNNSTDQLQFLTAGNLNPRLTIDSSGSVGIGTDSPGVELDVVGTIRGGIANKKGTYTDGDTTPSVAGISYLRILNTVATTITDFDDAVDGQVIYLEFANSNTTVNRSNAYLSGGTNFTGSANDMLVLFYSSSTTLWHEISRSVNS